VNDKQIDIGRRLGHNAWMPSNGQPSVSVSPAPSAAEAAAIVAAIERFRRATTTLPPAVEPALDPWARAAIHEGVSRAPQPDVPDPWINT
jgi:hypothetical protein